MVEKRVRRGICHSIYQCAKANNKYMANIWLSNVAKASNKYFLSGSKILLNLMKIS